MEGCSSGVGGNSNGCRDGGGKGDDGSEGYEDQQQRRRRRCDEATMRRRDDGTMPAMPITMLMGRAEEDGRCDCPAAAGDRTAPITRWAARCMASSGRHRPSLARQ